jgi:hypothetical protein
MRPASYALAYSLAAALLLLCASSGEASGFMPAVRATRASHARTHANHGRRLPPALAASTTAPDHTATRDALGRAPQTRRSHNSPRHLACSVGLSASSVSSSGSVLFDGSNPDAWTQQVATPSRIASPDQTEGSLLQSAAAASPGTDNASSAFSLTANNADIYPLTPTDNPRAQLITPTNIVSAGSNFWESYEVYVPTNFPLALTYQGWVTIGSPFYGAPFTATPPVNLMIMNGMWHWATDHYAPGGAHLLWSQPVAVGQWTRFTWHIIASQDGFAELYINGNPVTVTYKGESTQGFNFPVIDPVDDAGPWFSQLAVYMQANIFPSLTLYFNDFKIATTQSAAQS